MTTITNLSMDPHALTSAIRASTFAHGRALHARAIITGLHTHPFVANALICLYANLGSLELARQAFNETSQKDMATLTAMLGVQAQNGDITEARKMFDAMPQRDLVAFNAMISGYAQAGHAHEALLLFVNMQSVGLRPNATTLTIVLSACAQVASLAQGQWAHAYLHRARVACTVTLSNALVHMYAKCGRLDLAFQQFVSIKPKNIESYNTMMTGLAVHGCGLGALSLLSQVLKVDLKPDRVTFLCTLMACSHAGLVQDALICLDFMKRIFGIEPDSDHFGCVVDVLARGGLVHEAHGFMDAMPFEPDVHMWGALWCGCWASGETQLAARAARWLMEMDPSCAGRHVGFAHVHEMVGDREGAVRRRERMVEMGVERRAGSSCIEVDGMLHQFLAGDVSHSRAREIYGMVDELDRRLRSYVGGV
ncbi:pentatricopeptide repeat-containing protein At2g29760, chloroplastic [Amborella trichopoda]|uniref:Pentacotripeptide-repeat region of PRORP domain-containing protein n=1 Tax=Amborella trichopoda TaxID=13333 RepID=W1NLY6_AMBTC|nr:pentatricopeptide repeat-containing protein At2g29760, chloroplastic [Amborella trichopoda]ERM96269.1 hypothetical protein AMTR_s00001p00160280 [Amborella trichopoda]|eukprot:XP_006828853.1 pentatricopeptide repeat-containing protein At2g29760, chloroplastic [Amborella trichopoda]